ncbi:hypothetical protein AB4383_03960 [Vibrio breoganii]
MFFTRVSLLIAVFFFFGCSSLTAEQKEIERDSINEMANRTIEALIKDEPIIRQQLNDALAYGVGNMKVTKVPVIGVGGGEGVLVIKEDDDNLYFTIRRFDLGAGYGARSYKALIIINSKEIVDDWRDGEWKFEIGAEATAGSAAAEGGVDDLKGSQDFIVHILTDVGASATVTGRVVRVKINEELTE